MAKTEEQKNEDLYWEAQAILDAIADGESSSGFSPEAWMYASKLTVIIPDERLDGMYGPGFSAAFRGEFAYRFTGGKLGKLRDIDNG